MNDFEVSLPINKGFDYDEIKYIVCHFYSYFPFFPYLCAERSAVFFC